MRYSLAALLGVHSGEKQDLVTVKTDITTTLLHICAIGFFEGDETQERRDPRASSYTLSKIDSFIMKCGKKCDKLCQSSHLYNA
ncbi:hypothetical protein Plhal304r1_c010g0038901 [Plasmopara halstedii]